MSATLRYKHLKKSNKYSVYIDTYHEGNRHYEFLKIYVSKDYSNVDTSKTKNIKGPDRDVLAKAISICGMHNEDLTKGAIGLIPKYKQKLDFILYFEKVITNNPEKDNASYWGTLSKLKKHYKRIPFNSINSKWIKDFTKHLEGTVSSNTIRQYIERISLVLNDAVRKDKIMQFNPLTDYKLPTLQEPERTFLEFEEIQLLNKTRTQFNEHIRLGFLFSCFTGLRWTDVLNLTWPRIKNGKLQFRQQKSVKQFTYLPLTETALDILSQIERTDSPRVFHKMPKDNGEVNTRLREWAEAAGLSKHLHFHVARHTFCLLGLDAGNDLYTQSKLMGHRDIASTKPYLHILDKKKEEAVSKYPKL